MKKPTVSCLTGFALALGLAAGAAHGICLPDLVLTDRTVSDFRSFESCDSISAGSGFTVAATGDVVFVAGDSIALDDGFSVEAGGGFTARIGPPPEPGVLALTEVAASSGIAADYYAGATHHNLGVNWIDFDADGWPDLFLTNGFGLAPHLYHNLGGTFAKVDHLLPPLPNVELAGSAFGDYDNDGDLDVFIQVTNEQWNTWGFNLPDGPPDLLLKNLWVENGETTVEGVPLFVDVAAAAGVQGTVDSPLGTYPARRSMVGGWLDFDRDGCLDLYVGRLVFGSAWENSNLDALYRNRCDGSGAFDDQTVVRGLNDPLDATTLRPALAFFSGLLDGDLWPDIYTVNASPAATAGHDHRDLFYLNDGAGNFAEAVTSSPGLCDDAGAGMGIDVADLELDGDWDIYITDLETLDQDQPPDTNVLYLGNGDGTWADNSAPQAGVHGSSLWGASPFGANSWPANFFDADHDGYEDLLVGFWTQKVLFMNDRAGAFVPVVASAGLPVQGFPRGAAVADYDRDGDLDFAVVHREGRLELYRNDSSGLGHWIELRLEGATSNRAAIGTLVKAQAGDLSMMRQVKGGSSTHSQDDLVVHFGLGANQTVDELSIFWPSGLVQNLTDVNAGQFLSCSEAGGGTCSPWTP